MLCKDDDDDDENDAENEEESDKDADGNAGTSTGTTPGTVAIQDETETDKINLRRTIYLTIMSSLDFEECAHKMLKVSGLVFFLVLLLIHSFDHLLTDLGV